MKLYNRTKLSDDVLTKVLMSAAKTIGNLRTRNVVVKVTTASRSVSGCAEDSKYGKYYEWALDGGREDGLPSKLIDTDGGYLFLRIPYKNVRRDLIELAKYVFEIAAHEWKHIADFQNNRKFGQYNKNWKNRPHEKRAILAQHRAVEKLHQSQSIQNIVIDLAIEIEKYNY